ncbi:MAG: LicD family protein [Lachnospiraceae bacterium]|nr:LicD family protein [Lachnospiraceae bacterium]
MEQNTLRKLQLTQLSILKDFVKICEENDLKYFLDGGTMLGAVRHQGFIPWDDDLDVGMPRRDYDRFCKLAKKSLPKGYFLQTYFTDKNYPNAFAKLRKEGTEFVESITEKSKMRGGIYIDILPFDNFPEKKSEILSQGFEIELYKHLLIGKHRVYPWMGMKGKKRLFKFLEYAPFYPLAVFFDHDHLARKYDSTLKRYNKRTTDRIKEPDLRFAKVVVPADCGTDLIDVDFEDGKYLIPNSYDSFLKQLYGNDYMTPPPVESRGGWHGIKKLRF